MSVLSIMLAGLLSCSTPSKADTNPPKTPPQNEVDAAKEQLKYINSLLVTIRRPIERFKLGGWTVLHEDLDAVLQTINRNNGVGNDETGEAYKELVSGVETSKDYFSTIETESTKQAILDLQRIAGEIKVKRKMSSTLFSHNTLRLFTKIHDLIDQLKSLPIQPKLKQALNNIEPQLVAVFAEDKIQGGDSYNTFVQGRTAVTAIRKLYPLFEEASVNEQIFQITSSIQGYVYRYAFIANMSAQQKAEDGEQR